MVGKEELLTALKQAKTEAWVSKIRTVFLSSRERTQGTIQATYSTIVCWLHRLSPQQKAPSLEIWKGENQNLTVTLYHLQKHPDAKAAWAQPAACLEKAKHISEHWSIVTQTTRVTSDYFYATKKNK